jgi:DNA-binding Lrp family transcriptional regulator
MNSDQSVHNGDQLIILDRCMDDMDDRLIAALRHDARASLSDLAARLGVSRTTLRARLARLQSRGEIVGFSVITRADVARDPVRGLMMIGIEGRGADRIKRHLAGMAELRAVHSTNGRWDLIVEIGSATLVEFDEVLNRIRKLDGVVSSETNLLLSTQKAG